MSLSPLVWGRGLKPHPRNPRKISQVAPRMGAWIETNRKQRNTTRSWSPLVWGRGLKQEIIITI